MRGFVPTFTPGRMRLPRPLSTVLPIPSAPATPSTPSPADTATAYYTLLSWVSARATNFDVYLGTSNPPTTIVAPKIQSTSYIPTLLPATTYYWRIAAFNAGGSATGPVWSFTTPAATAMLFSLAGSIVTSLARFGSLSIRDIINAAPNTASLSFGTTAPTAGQAIKIGLGTLDAKALEFGGEIQSVDESYVDTTFATVWPVNLIDYTFAINKRRPFGTWTNVSATTIAQYCVTTFAPGFTSTHVQAGLPLVSINFDGSADFMSCMSTLAQAASTSAAPCYTYVDYAKDLHLFNVAESDGPTALTTDHPPLNVPSPIAFSTDLSQVRTRAYGKGHSETVPADVAVGETIVPIADAVMFTSTGGRAICGTTSGGAQTQIITYAGTTLSGTSSTVVGTNQSPSTMSASANSTVLDGHVVGLVGYKVAFAGAAGESELSAAVTATGSGVAQLSTASTTSSVGGAGNVDTGNHSWFISAFTAQGETAILVSGGATAGPGGPSTVTLSSLPVSSDTRTIGRRLYRTKAGGTAVAASLFLVATLDNVVTSYVDNIADANLGNNPPTVDGSGGSQVTLTNVPLGPTGTTSRRIYRTAGGGSVYKFLTALADNVTTTVVDKAADSSLGALHPGNGSSTIGTTIASTTLPVADLSQFVDTGWVTVGSAWIRYTGRSATSGAGTLTGILSSGAYSILVAVPYGATVFQAPALTGVNSNNGLSVAMGKGSSVAIWVQRDDLSAQTALGLLELDDNGNPTDGIREYTIVNGSRGEASLIAQCDADLALFSRPIVSASYYTRDVNTRAGRTVSIDLAGYATTVLRDAPIAYWRLGDAVGSGTATDSSGNGNTGTVHGGVTFGRAGALADGTTAALFDGSSGYISSAVAIPASLSIEACVNPSALGNFLRIFSSGSNFPAELAIANDQGLYFFLNFVSVTPGWIATGFTLPFNSWTHVALTWDGTTLCVYANGSQVYSNTAWSGNVLQSGTAFIGGVTGGGSYLPGLLDEVALYNYALTAEHVASHNSRRSVSVGGTSAWGQTGSFVIQDVTVTCDGPGLYPLRQVKASSVSFTLSDLLRRVVVS